VRGQSAPSSNNVLRSFRIHGDRRLGETIERRMTTRCFDFDPDHSHETSAPENAAVDQEAAARARETVVSVPERQRAPTDVPACERLGSPPAMASACACRACPAPLACTVIE
jgi:hypothetical protein